MDTQDILKSLANLERNLQGIESAKQQVEKTVAAYDSTRLQLSKLSQDLSGISSELHTIVTTIRDNQQELDASISEKIEMVFANINNEASRLSETATDISKSFNSSCEKTVKTVRTKIDETISTFNEDVQQKLSEIASAITGFKSLITSIEGEFKSNASLAIANIQKSLDAAVNGFVNRIEGCLKDFSNLKDELGAIVNQQKKLNEDIYSKIKSDADDIKASIVKLDKHIKESQDSIESYHKELASMLLSIQQGTDPSAQKVSDRFNSVDGSLGEVQNKVSSVLTQLGTATNHIIDENKQTILSEIKTLKGENASIKKLVVFCLVVIAISLLLNVINFIK